MKKPIILTLSIILLIMMVIFTLQNAQNVHITYFFWDGAASLALLLVITLAIGIAAALIILVPVIAHLRRSKANENTTRGIEMKKGLTNDPYSASHTEKTNTKFYAKFRR